MIPLRHHALDYHMRTLTHTYTHTHTSQPLSKLQRPRLLHRQSLSLLHLRAAKTMVKQAHKKKRPLALTSTTGIGAALKKMGKTGAAATKGALDAFVVPMQRYVAPPSLPPGPEKSKPKPFAAASKPPTPRSSSSSSSTTAKTMPRVSGPPPPPPMPPKPKPAAVAAAATKPPTPTPTTTATTAALSTDWLVERLHGGHGRGDAQASWDARRTEKLTATDVALCNKRRLLGQQAKARQPGWRVQGDKRVFVAYTGAGMQVAEGAEAFKLSMVFGKGKGKVEGAKGGGGGGGGEAGKGGGGKGKKKKSDKEN